MKEEIIYPNYDNCVLNLITSVLKYYNVETKYKGNSNLEAILQKKYKNVVIFILDGMGTNLLKSTCPNGFLSSNKIEDITSVCPSTTTAVMNTYYSGKPPIETGYIAWSQYFKEYGRTLDMFPRVDSYTGEKYKNAKMDVFDMLKYKSIFEQIEENSPNVKTYEINPSNCDSRAKKCIKADTVKDMCEMIKSLCKNDDNNFIFTYHISPDKILHKKGCDSVEVKDFIIESDKLIEEMVKKLEGTNTLLIVSADHGHNDIGKRYTALDLGEINEYLIMPPSLESRAVTFWVKEEKKVEFEKAFKEKFKDEFILFTKKEFLEKHLLGYGEQHKKIDDFIGDYIAISISDAMIKIESNISPEKADKLSTHCGFTANEMIVPLIVKEIK